MWIMMIIGTDEKLCAQLIRIFFVFFTLAMSSHQHHVGATPVGKFAAFIFASLTSWSKQGKLIVEKDAWTRVEE
jgi:hypothetical protein